MKRVLMFRNGLVDSWMLKAHGLADDRVLLTGCTETETERIGRKLAAEHDAEFVRDDRSAGDDEEDPR